MKKLEKEVESSSDEEIIVKKKKPKKKVIYVEESSDDEIIEKKIPRKNETINQPLQSEPLPQLFQQPKIKFI